MPAIPREIKMGGQAVIEGVMMRGAESWAVAVRSPGGEIRVKKEPWRSLGQKFKALKFPVLRGAVVLVETLVLGVKALSYSAETASEAPESPASAKPPAREEKKGFWWSLSLAGTVIISLSAGLAVFFYLPLMLTEMLGITNPFWFNVVDGLLRIAIFLGYLLIISRWRDIRRVFEYHGAEHKTISAYEGHQELRWENIRKFSRFHPRCGTSFILVLMLLSIFIFMLFGKPANLGEKFLRMLLVPLIGGISYEIIKLSDRYPDNRLTRIMVAPGLWLQRITTRPPDEGQVEVAVAALKAALGLDQEVAGEPVAVAAMRDG